jgi:hypothetical protein
MKLVKVMRILWKLAGYLAENLPDDSTVKDEADFLKKVAIFLMAEVDKVYIEE